MLAQTNTETNLLKPLGRIYNAFESRYLQRSLIDNLSWQTEYYAFGRQFSLPRKQAWYADDGVHYRYSDNLLTRQSWTPRLLSVKERVEQASQETFNSVLITYYPTGKDHVTWHADDEPELGDKPVIASLSLGATRTFHWRSKRGTQNAHIALNDGELLVMSPEFQHEWEHCVPPDPKIHSPRINLTFRNVVMKREN